MVFFISRFSANQRTDSTTHFRTGKQTALANATHQDIRITSYTQFTCGSNLFFSKQISQLFSIRRLHISLSIFAACIFVDGNYRVEIYIHLLDLKIRNRCEKYNFINFHSIISIYNIVLIKYKTMETPKKFIFLIQNLN